MSHFQKISPLTPFQSASDMASLGRDSGVMMINLVLQATCLALLQLLVTSWSVDGLNWQASIRGILANAILFWCLLLPAYFITRRWIRYLWLLFPCIISALINTHIELNGAMPSVAHAGLADNSAFIQGVISQRELYIWFLAALSVVVIGARPLRIDAVGPSGFVRYGTASSLLLFLVLTFVSPSPTFALWYAKNLVEFNLPEGNMEHSSQGVIDGRLLVDSRRVATGTAARAEKVVLVLVEGLSEAHVSAGWMPRLREREASGYRVPQFLNHQRQTNRGLFSIFCGAYPNLRTSVSKSDLMATSGLEQQCLPQALERSGIKTAYIQSANLNYMFKDLFAESAGFSTVRGGAAIKNVDLRGIWGVDDKSLYREGLNYLESTDGPAFLAMLTTGTHPPYEVPGGVSGRKAAFEYADASIDWLINQLIASGQLENTLVMISSDESSTGKLTASSRIPPDNLGYLLILGGDVSPGEASGIFGQVDIYATLMSVFGLQEMATGVSVFDTPHPERRLYAGNIFKQEIIDVTRDKVERCNFKLHCENPEIEARLEDFIAKNDLSSAGSPHILATIEDRVYDTQVDDQIIGRFITEQPRGTTLLAKINLDTSNSPRGEKDKVFEMIGWDCEETTAETFDFQFDLPGGASAETLNFQFDVPGGVSEFPRYIAFPQMYKNQCHKIWVQNGHPENPSQWRLIELLLESIPQETEAIKRLDEENRVPQPAARIAHAGGGLDGKTYVNSIEALDRNYENGFRLFELDFIWTSDDHLVCGHDWDVSVTQNYGFDFNGPPTLDNFMSAFSELPMAPCTISELAEWLVNHPDAFVVTDIKWNNLQGLATLKAGLGGDTSQLIPQIYHPSEYDKARSLGYDELILTLYRYRESTLALLQSLQGKDLFAVTMPQSRVIDGLAVLLRSVGFATYTHTINEPSVLELVQSEWGIDEIYTDILLPVGSPD